VSPIVNRVQQFRSGPAQWQLSLFLAVEAKANDVEDPISIPVEAKGAVVGATSLRACGKSLQTIRAGTQPLQDNLAAFRPGSRKIQINKDRSQIAHSFTTEICVSKSSTPKNKKEQQC